MSNSAPTRIPTTPPQPWAQVAAFVARHRRNPLVKKLARVCRQYLDWYANSSFDLRINGEAFVLETLATFHPRVVFDVGANIGDWTITAASCCPGAAIHAFEIAKPTFEMLMENTRAMSNVHRHNLGLSDAAGTIPIRYYPAIPALTTATEYPHPLEFTEIPGQVITGDSYAESENIGHIDLLKIDVEGMEERVLRGFEPMLARKAIDLVQFEYGRVNIMNRFFLRDFHAFFRDRGYVVGKIFPNGVDFRQYDFADEDFVVSNHLACRQDKPEYVRAFGHVQTF